ncbi:ABC transporter substrate-binding protein [Leptothoe sp. PORK10 BA2]|uniref:ABC transporter substrate-binding protein n=1 Tax=Leptothoe sp. PORK10 BA2 TaxID=3110254 RepID=UPI002B1F789A|nr:CHAT domain-containing protein [Leptothoe sp. PORK10 BA2]MEA5467233.1 CHAT domain-containing protein [Leptothoe sp. PORK10 BA2]
MNQLHHTSSNIAVVVRFVAGTFEAGFDFDALILKDGRQIHRYPEAGERLDTSPYRRTPPALELPALYQEWQSSYLKSEKARGRLRDASGGQAWTASDYDVKTRKINVPEDVETHYSSSVENARTAAVDLRRYLRENWFQNEGSFENLRFWITGKAEVQRDQSLPIFFEFNTPQLEQNYILRRLPWHLWDLVQTDFFNKAEIALSANAFREGSSLTTPIKVLAIFGSDEGDLDLGKDRATLARLRDFGAEVHVLPPNLEEPESESDKASPLTSADLLRALTQDSYDILFYAGHSSSDREYRDGYLYLGNDNYCTLTVLQPRLLEAIDRGLKLAIFNSCDGLGLADFLVRIRLPYTVLFRESVPDPVATAFLGTFFENFSTGKPLYSALRRARTKLIELEDNYPSASWLPIICQSQSQPELVWPDLTAPPLPPKPYVPNPPITDKENGKKSDKDWKKWAAIGVSVMAVGVAAFIIPPLLWPQKVGSSLTPEYISIGEDRLIDSAIWQDEEGEAYVGCFPNKNLKEDAVTAFRSAYNSNSGSENWGEVIGKFEEYRKVCPSDPEALIYLNNARVFNSGKPFIRIAAVAPLGHSDTVSLALELLRGYAQGQETLNQNGGGIDGRLIQIQVANDTPSTSHQDKYKLTEDIAKALEADSAIFAVLTSTSDTTKRASDIYAGSGIISVSSTSTAVRGDAFQLDKDSVFRLANTDSRAAQDLAKVIQERGYETVGMVYESNEPYSQSIKLQNKIALTNIADISAPDICDLSSPGGFSPNRCAEVMADLDAVLLLPSTEISGDIQRVVLNLDDFDEKPALFGGDAVFGANTLAELGTKAEGMIVAIPWHQSINTGKVNPFLNEASGIWKISPGSFNWRTGLAYDSVMAVVGAIGKMNLPLPEADERQILTRQDVEGIANIMKDNSFDGFLGPNTISFDQSGDRELIDSLDLGFVVEVQCTNSPDPQCGFGKPQ